MRVFFYVQHLLGIGHLKRAATIARALRGAGFDVTLASGGPPVEGIDVLQLPPVSSPDFKLLIDESGRPVDEAWKRRRAAALLEAYRKIRPDALLIELFPFGRRQMRFELLPLLQEATSRLIACSVRDILQPKPGREDEALERFDCYFDRLLVHGDPRLAPFEVGFSKTARLAGKLQYTGYVVDDSTGNGTAGQDEVLVSAGGGAVARRLLEIAIATRPLTSLRARTWRLLAGTNSASIEELRRHAAPGVIVERARDDFTLLLRNCLLSVSQAGYNTAMETLRARARAVLVPFAGGGESEQTMRAKVLAERGLVQMVEERALSPQTLAVAIERALLAPRPDPDAVDLNGARRTAELLREWLR